MAFLLRSSNCLETSTDGVKPKKKSKISRKEQALLLETLRESLRQSVDEKERISSELQLMQSNNNNLQDEITQLKQRVASLEGENERHKMEKSDLQKNNMRLSTELQALRIEFNGIHEKHKLLSQEKDHWLVELGSDDKAQELFSELECVKQKVQELERSDSKLKSENTGLLNQWNDLNHDFKLLQQQHDKTKTENDRLMEEVEDLRDEVEVLDNQNHQMQQWLGKYKSTRTVLDGARAENTKLEDQIKMGRKYGQKLQKDHAELREKYEALRRQSSSAVLEKENGDLRAENERLLKALQAIEEQI